MFTVYANTPGYLSEDEDPFTTDSLDEARTALVDMLARDEGDEISGAYAVSEGDASRDTRTAVLDMGSRWRVDWREVGASFLEGVS